jgi:hypothetical protein
MLSGQQLQRLLQPPVPELLLLLLLLPLLLLSHVLAHRALYALGPRLMNAVLQQHCCPAPEVLQSPTQAPRLCT